MTVNKMLADWDRYSRPLIALLNPQRRPPRDNPASIRYIRLSSDLPPGDGSTSTGHGKGKLMDHKNGTNPTAPGALSVPSDATDVDVYGLLMPGLKSGSVIAAFQLGNAWHYLLTLCTNVKG